MSRDADDATAATKREGQECTTVDPRPPSEAEGGREDERLARGTLVGRCVVSHVLGAGGMGVAKLGDTKKDQAKDADWLEKHKR